MISEKAIQTAMLVLKNSGEGVPICNDLAKPIFDEIGLDFDIVREHAQTASILMFLLLEISALQKTITEMQNQIDSLNFDDDPLKIKFYNSVKINPEYESALSILNKNAISPKVEIL